MIDMEQMVETRWSNNTKAYYTNKGYIFTKRGDTFVVKISDLTASSAAKVRYTCDCCGKGIVVTYDCYNKLATNICHSCTLISMQKKKIVPFSVVKSEFELAGYTVIIGDYRITSDKVDYVCSKHGMQSMSYSNFSQGYRCPGCNNDNHRGSKNPAWKGGVTELSRHLRGSLSAWTLQQLHRTNHTCELTGKQGVLNVHHMYSFINILSDTMKELNMDIRPNIGDYSEDELQLITINFLKNNDILANPIVILESVHKMFHSFCGGTNKETTFNQLQEFKESLKEVS